MSLLKLAKTHSSFKFFGMLIALAVVNTIWSSLLLLLINSAVNQEKIPFAQGYDWQLFVVLILLSFAASKLFQNYMIKISNDVAYNLNISIFNNLRFADFESFKKIGKERVYTSITDAYTLASFPQSFIEILNNGITFLVVLVYFFFISVYGGLLILGVIMCLAVLFYIRNERISQKLNELRDLSEGYHENIHDLLNGFENIKMSSVKNDNIYFKFLKDNREKVRSLNIKTSKQYYDNELTGTYSWYLIIGFIIFLLPVLITISPNYVSNYIVTILFLLGPLNSLIGLIPNITKMNIALQRIESFDAELQAKELVQIGHGKGFANEGVVEKIMLKNVAYEYYDAKKQQIFKLGPINASFEAGELVFITGGNGSGKTTLLNLISGLTSPSSGEILMNDTRINTENVQAYRDGMSAILSKDYLFKNNYAGYDFIRQRSELDEYIELMQLSEVVRIDAQNEFIFTDLSKGQQKRLAMVHALMESKPILILDEWAAEQDPEFRKFFYHELLDRFKKKGKTVILVTHDDRYFHLADKVLKMEFGKLISIEDEKLNVLVES